MSDQHTKGLFELHFHEGSRQFYVDVGPVQIRFERTSDAGGPEMQANARRIVATWNACDGITTDMLESVPGLLPAMMPYRILREQRAALLVALVWREQFEPRAGESSNDTIERIAEVFQRETGHLRPGKDCAIERLEIRQRAWDEWMQAGRERVRAAIAKATEAAA